MIQILRNAIEYTFFWATTAAPTIDGVTPSILLKLAVSPDAKAAINGPRDAFGRSKGMTAAAIFGARFADNSWLKIALSGICRCRLELYSTGACPY